MTRREAERQEAIEKLMEWVKKGDTVYSVLRKSSRSGKSRDVSLVVFRGGTPTYLSYWVAKLLGKRCVPSTMGHAAIKCTDLGQDSGFTLVYEMCSVLYGIENAYSLCHQWL